MRRSRPPDAPTPPPPLDPARRPLIAEVLKALGHPDRLHAVELLAAGEHTVSELCEALGLAQAAVSQHMTVLRHAAVVSVRREGARRHYALAHAGLVELLRCLARCQEHCPSLAPHA